MDRQTTCDRKTLHRAVKTKVKSVKDTQKKNYTQTTKSSIDNIVRNTQNITYVHYN